MYYLYLEKHPCTGLVFCFLSMEQRVFAQCRGVYSGRDRTTWRLLTQRPRCMPSIIIDMINALAAHAYGETFLLNMS